MDLNNPIFNNPALKKPMRTIKIFILLWCAAEIAIFAAALILFEAYYVFWATVGFTILGVIIKPARGQGLVGMGNPRLYASIMFMIPGFLLDLAAILVLIGPIRRRIGGVLQKRFMLPGMGAGNPFGGMGTGNPFCGMGAGNNASQAPHQDIIDIEPHTGGSSAKAEIIRDKPQPSAPKALASEAVIDVEYETDNR